MRQPRPRVNRRDLLRLRRLGAGLSASPRDPAATGPVGAADLIRASRPAMGSYFEVRVAASTPGASDLLDRVLDRIDALERQLTVYRDDSEVSLLNARAHHGPVPVEPGLFRLLEAAVAIGDATAGAYDVTSGALSEAWGFTRGPRRVPAPEVLEEARRRTGQCHLLLDQEATTLAFDRPGIVVNLGSIGKGYAIDRAVDLVRDHWWPTAALIHGGRSSLYALGSPPGRFGGRWEVALRNPFSPEKSLGIVRLRDRGMGTSGASFQQFEEDGEVYGHILDPRTGRPARGPASVTVLAATAAEADAYSTAFYLLGADAASAVIDAVPGLGAIFIEGDGDGPPAVRAFGLTDADFRIEL